MEAAEDGVDPDGRVPDKDDGAEGCVDEICDCLTGFDEEARVTVADEGVWTLLGEGLKVLVDAGDRGRAGTERA